MLDLANVDVNKKSENGYEFDLLHPVTNEPTGAKLSVRGDQSATVRNYHKRKYNELKQREVQAKRRGREPEDISLDEAEDLAIESAAIRLISWEGIGKDGKLVPFSAENATMILKENAWIRDQIMEASQNLANFL